MANFNLRDNLVRYILEDADDVLDAEAPSFEYLDELFGVMETAADVRIIIVGQDAYPDRSKRCAMAFSYPRGVEASDSVLSIIKAANKGLDNEDTLEITPKDGYLGTWRDQGVLLVNCRGAPYKSLIASICRLSEVVGILLGREAIEATSEYFKVAYSWSHPSRRSTINNDPKHPEHWSHTDVFWRANQHLLRSGRGIVNWASVYGTGRIFLFVDGGYSSKQSRGKCGVVAYSSLGSYLADDICVDRYVHGSENVRITTNNVAELSAFRMAIDTISATPTWGRWVIYSDSEYSIKSITIWYHDWVRNDKLVGKKNVPLIAKIVSEFDSLSGDVSVKHTRGHQPPPPEDASPLKKLIHRGNDHVDVLVSMA